MQGFFYFERGRDQQSEQRVDTFRTERAKDRAHDVFQRRESGLFFVDVYDDLAAGGEGREQAAECGRYIGAMLQDAHAENFVEGGFAQWNFVDAGLNHGKIWRARIVAP